MRKLLADRGTRTFLTIWSSQVLSSLGTGLTSFALGVWIYELSGSVTLFAATMLASIVPGIALTPIAGMYVDRWDRRRTVLVCELGRAAGTLAIAVLLLTGRFELWHLWVAVAVSASFGAFKVLASSAMVVMLIPKEQYGRAAGLLQLGRPMTRIVSPLLSATLLAAVGIEGVILVDFFTFLVPITALLFVRVPNPERRAEDEEGGSPLQEFTYGWRFIRERPGVLGLLSYFAVINVTMGLAHALYRPLILTFASVKVAGLIGSVGSAGAVLSGVLLAVWGGPKRRVDAILIFGLVYSLGVAFIGLRADPVLVGGALFVLIFGVPIIRASMRMIWMCKTPAEAQGRVFAVWTIIARLSVLVAYVLAGPLADGVFEPLMAADGALADSFGRVIGTGPGRGIGLLYMVLGACALAATAVAFLNPAMRRVEELPDADVAERHGSVSINDPLAQPATSPD